MKYRSARVQLVIIPDLVGREEWLCIGNPNLKEMRLQVTATNERNYATLKTLMEAIKNE